MIIVTLHKPLTHLRLQNQIRNLIKNLKKDSVNTIHIEKFVIKLKDFQEFKLIENITIDRQN